MAKCPFCGQILASREYLEQHLKKCGKKKPKHTRHKYLKIIAKEYLKDLGFSDNEIFEEYVIKEGQMKKALRVDVVGIKGERRIAIECGRTPADKIAQLNLYFDEVICLPYMNERLTKGTLATEFFKKQNRELSKKLSQATQKIAELEEKIAGLKGVVEAERELFGKAVIVWLYNLGCLPSKILHSGYKEVVEEYKEELETNLRQRQYEADGLLLGLVGLRRKKERIYEV